jgi:hypothetical protein
VFLAREPDQGDRFPYLFVLVNASGECEWAVSDEVRHGLSVCLDRWARYLPAPSRKTEALPEEGRHRVRRDDLERQAMKYVVDCCGAGRGLPTQKELAEALGCSERLVRDLRVWDAVRQLRRDDRRPSVASLTSQLEAALGGEDESLQRLIGEESADDDDRKKRPRLRKKL